MNAPKTNKSEKDLVIRLIQDDENAFCELYANYKNRLFYYTMKYTKSSDFAEDVYQDAFTAVWQTRHFIDPDQPFSTYLYTIVRNRILNLIRNIDTEENLKDYILSQAIDYTENTHEKIAENDLQEILSHAMLKLTVQQRKIFDMSRNQGLSYKEIATELNISTNTVQVHVSAALKTLQNYLRKHYGTYSELLLILWCLNA